jgi:hypothetical protein
VDSAAAAADTTITTTHHAPAVRTCGLPHAPNTPHNISSSHTHAHTTAPPPTSTAIAMFLRRQAAALLALLLPVAVSGRVVRTTCLSSVELNA